jgi:predicted secreted protein
MSWFTGVLLYVIIWWVLLFMVLPWGAKPPEEPESGHEPGAPARPMLGRKALATSLLAGVVWLLIYAGIQAEIVTFEGALRKG